MSQLGVSYDQGTATVLINFIEEGKPATTCPLSLAESESLAVYLAEFTKKAREQAVKDGKIPPPGSADAGKSGDAEIAQAEPTEVAAPVAPPSVEDLERKIEAIGKKQDALVKALTPTQETHGFGPFGGGGGIPGVIEGIFGGGGRGRGPWSDGGHGGGPWRQPPPPQVVVVAGQPQVPVYQPQQPIVLNQPQPVWGGQMPAGPVYPGGGPVFGGGTPVYGGNGGAPILQTLQLAGFQHGQQIWKGNQYNAWLNGQQVAVVFT